MEEWSSLVKTAFVALILVLLISIVLVFVYLGLNTANKGAEKLTNSTTAMDLRSFDPYNQTVVSGTAVFSAIKAYQNQPVAVLVRTKAGSFINYDAYLLSDDTIVTAPGLPWNVTNGFSAVIPGIYVSSTRVLNHQYQNLDLTDASNRSKPAYINPTAKFRSVLIHDANDEIVGIYMEQVGGSTQWFTF